MTLDQWRSIYAGEVNNWSQLGGPDKTIVRLGRKPTESVFRTIVYSYPNFINSTFATTLDKDDQMVKAISRTPGSIGFSDRLGLAKHPEVQILEIEGFECLLEVGLVYDETNADNPALQQIMDFVRSDHWHDMLVANPQMAPPDAWHENSLLK